MRIIEILRQKLKLFFVLFALLGLVKALLNFGLLVIINSMITQTPLPYAGEYEWAVFLFILLASFFSSRLFQGYMIKLTNGILFDAELSILQKVKASTLEKFVKLGNEKVYTAIDDTRTLAAVPQIIINSLNSVVILVCCLIYLFSISPVGGALVLLLMGGLLVFYRVKNASLETELDFLRNMHTSYHYYLNDFLHGFREIKMSSVRSHTIYDGYLAKNRLISKDLETKNSTKYLNNELLGNYSWYIILGVIIFVLPALRVITLTQTVSFITTLLFVMGPVAVLITLLPLYTKVKVAMKRLDDFEESLGTTMDPEPAPLAVSNVDPGFEQLEFRDVVYEYTDSQRQNTFVVGPLNLRIAKGELIFVTGGNGSGKSTFVNLVTGLYPPQSGSVWFNGRRLTENDYHDFRDKVSAIFTSHYLMGENYDGFDFTAQAGALQKHIDAMRLADIAQVDYSRNIISRNLSKGQQKRVMMILALLEDKDILVLDEWAAEQDPHFRAYFYHTFIPELQRRGKTIIAVTHDDDYFKCADRLIRFDYGRIVSDTVVYQKQEAISTHP
ncbi:MAG: cyclic peptide export ABC transporter [Cytophagales bacterium]|nr:cyclic peptide export ABC transporter [Cytophagales bacterium]